MIQTSIRAEARRITREEQKQAKLSKKRFAIANERLTLKGKQPRSRDQRKRPRGGDMITLRHLLDAQDAGQLAHFKPEVLEPFARELQRRAHVITKRKIKEQFGIGKYFPAGKHKNCDKRGISPKRLVVSLAPIEILFGEQDAA
jgi:hypothetical protein